MESKESNCSNLNATPLQQNIYNRLRDISSKLKDIEASNHQEDHLEIPSELNDIATLISQCQDLDVLSNRNIHLIPTKPFTDLILESALYRVAKIYPHYFGTGNPADLLLCLYQEYYAQEKLPYEVFEKEIIKAEKCAYIVESKDDKVCDKVLRIDFYRLLGMSEYDSNKRYDSFGGILQALAYFKVNGHNISYCKGEIGIDSLNEFLALTVKAFYDNKWESEQIDKFSSCIDYGGRYLDFVFDYSHEANVYFLKTVYIEPK